MSPVARVVACLTIAGYALLMGAWNPSWPIVLASSIVLGMVATALVRLIEALRG